MPLSFLNVTFIRQTVKSAVKKWSTIFSAIEFVFMAGLVPCLSVAQSWAGGTEFPFQPGEQLQFQVKWRSIPVAEAVLEVLPFESFGGVKAYHFSLTAKTNATMGRLYAVHRRIDSYADLEMTHALHYEKRDEEDKEKHIIVYFDWKGQTAQYTRVHKRRKPVMIPPRTFDPLSVFYAFRLFELKEGLILTAPVTDGKRYCIGKAKVIGRERIDLESGTYDTFLVEPDLGPVGGIFRKSKDARLLIWVTTDDRHIPVRIESEVAVGRFVGELVSYRQSRGEEATSILATSQSP